MSALLDASRALVAISARSIAAGAASVTLPQFRMLVVLTEGPRKLIDLAGELDVVPSTAARMVNRLVEAGLVDRTVPPENRRETRLSLTPRGRRTVTKVTEARRRSLASVVDSLPEDGIDELTRAMHIFAVAAAGPAGCRSALDEENAERHESDHDDDAPQHRPG